LQTVERVVPIADVTNAQEVVRVSDDIGKQSHLSAVHFPILTHIPVLGLAIKVPNPNFQIPGKSQLSKSQKAITRSSR